MPALVMVLDQAQRRDGGFTELARDPLLSVACIALIVVCLLWVVLGRAITRNLDKHSLKKQKKAGSVQPAKDIWRDPPE